MQSNNTRLKDFTLSSPKGFLTLQRSLFHVVAGDGLEAIEEVAGGHARLTSELEIKDLEPLVGGCDEETGFFHEKHSGGS